MGNEVTGLGGSNGSTRPQATRRMASSGGFRDSSHFGVDGRIELSTSFYVSAAVVVAVALVIRWRGRKLLRALIHPLAERGRLSFFEAYPIGPEDTVFLGDSITAGGQWEEIAPGTRIRNRGIGGDQTDDLLKRLEHITKGRPRKLFVLIGTNDLASGVPQDEIVRNLESILDHVRDESPETRVHLHELFPRKAAYRERILSLNAEIARLAEARGLDLIPVFSRFADQGGAIRPELSYDNLHLSGLGYQEWQSALAEHLHDS